MAREGDMIVNLTALADVPALPGGVTLKRAMGPDRQRILAFVKENFGDGWKNEADVALCATPSHCVIAVKEQQVVGFCCYDATAKGFFGPIGVAENMRGTGIGAALTLRTLHLMRNDGYGYGIIGWVGDAADFYRKVVGAEFIPGGEPENSVYSNLIHMG